MVKRIILCAIIALFSVEAGAQSARSNQLFDEGVELYRQGKYREAISVFSRVDLLDKLDFPEGNPRREYAALWMASCYYKLGDEAKARELDSLTYVFPPVDRRLTVQSDSLSVLAQEYINVGDYESALPLVRQCAALEKEALGANSIWYANSLGMYANCLLYAGHDLEEVMQATAEPLAIYTNYNMYSGMANMYYLIGDVYYNMSDYEKAFQAYGQSKDYYRKDEDELSAYSMLASMAECKNLLGKASEGLPMALEAAEFFAQSPDAGKECYAYGKTISTAAIAYAYMDSIALAYRYAREAKPIFEAEGDHESYYYYSNELCLAIAAAHSNQPDAKELVSIVKKEMDEIGWTGTSDYAMLCQHYLHQNIDSMSQREIISMVKTILNTFGNTLGKEHVMNFYALFDIMDFVVEPLMNSEGVDLLWKYLTELEPIARTNANINAFDRVRLYSYLGTMAANGYNRYDEGIGYLLQGKAIAEKSGITDSFRYCSLLSTLGQIYSNCGKNDEAFQSFLLAKSIYERASLPKDDIYVNLQSGICQYYVNVGDYLNADKILLQVRTERDSIVDSDASSWIFLAANDVVSSIRNNDPDEVTEKKVNTLLKLNDEVDDLQRLTSNYAFIVVALSYMKKGRYQEAQDYMERGVNGMRKILDFNPAMSAVYQGMLALVYQMNGNPERALSVINATLQEARLMRETNPQYFVQLLGFRVNIQTGLNKAAETTADANDITRMLSDIVSNNFRSMTYRERTLFWNQYSAWFTYTLPGLLQLNRSDELLPSAYNSMLLSKGLLLNSEVEVGKLIAEKGNEDAWKLYEDIQFHRARLTKLAQNCGNGAEYDQLNRQIQRMEKQLMQISKEYGDYTQKLTITWEDVKRHLSPGEVAIEFVPTPYFNQDRAYIALVVKPEYDCPHRVDLCQESQISGIAPVDLYNTADLWSCVWQPLSDELEGVKRIYFSPAGQLYSTAIEYAAMSDGDVMNNRYEMYRLSSTREVALQEAKTSELDAVVYGGLEFDADYQTLAEVNDEQKGLDVFRPRALVNNLEDLRGGVANLPGTEREAQDIVQLFSNTRRQCHLFDGLNGTEESFKWLSGARKNVLHIATHGFYWKDTDETSPVANLESFLQLENMPTIPAEDKMLSRNGLLFAGANVALRNGEVPDGRDDGILTALELSGLDFRGLDLVVLSACQTGLGEVTGEGVFGLQRGFKKAGAQTLMMSLWKVDDQATRLLMTEFYRNLLDGKSKRIAFNNAQQYLRTVENGKYNLPRYWAAFILLDGI